MDSLCGCRGLVSRSVSTSPKFVKFWEICNQLNFALRDQSIDHIFNI